MDFWATLWASVWGALAGALVAYFLALDLRRRQSRSDYEDRLNAAVVAITTAVRLVARTKRASRWKRLGSFSRHRTIVDEEIILTAVEKALVLANNKDLPVFEMFETRLAAYFAGTTIRGRKDVMMAALKDIGVYDNSTAERWLLSNSPVRAAIALWSSWERTPMGAAGVLLRWRRGEISADETVRLLDPDVTPIYELTISDEEMAAIRAEQTRYGHYIPRALRPRDQKRGAGDSND